MDQKKLKKSLDKLWILAVKTRAGFRCEVCRESLTELDAHHIFGRGESVRWDLNNGMCLCRIHHTLGKISAHSTSQQGRDEFNSYIRGHKDRQVLDEMKRKSKLVVKHTPDDLQAIYKNLKERLAHFS
jgi:predicted restriction endonuclease